MSFLSKIPANIKLLENDIQKLDWSKREFYGHECDCEFCDRQDDGRDEDELGRIDREIRDNEILIERLKNHVMLWGKKRG